MSKIVTLAINRSFGSSMGNMIEVLSGEASAKLNGNWIKVEKISPGVFQIIEDNLTSGSDWITDSCALGFCSWDDEVTDLDAGNSDESQCFCMSDHLRWNDVELTPRELRAPSIKRLKEALHHVAFCAWCPGDI